MSSYQQNRARLDVHQTTNLLGLLPPPHTYIEAQWLAEEAFPRLESGLVGLEFVAAEDGGDDEGEFHLGLGVSFLLVWLLEDGEDGGYTSATLRPTHERGP